MRLAKSFHPKRMNMNMTSMIDVVFLLLIFFMTCSQISKANRTEVELPQLKGTDDQSRSEIIANIDSAGRLTVSGEPYSVPEFVAMCSREAARQHDNDPSRLMISVRADRRGDCRTVNQLVSGLTKLGVTKVRFAVKSQP
jgi:biopolymer transport protein ExbD